MIMLHEILDPTRRLKQRGRRFKRRVAVLNGQAILTLQKRIRHQANHTQQLKLHLHATLLN